MRSVFGVVAISVAIALSPLTPSLAAWPEKERRDAIASCAVSGHMGSGDRRWVTLCECMMRGFEEAYPDRREFERVDPQDAKYKALYKKLWESCPFS